MELEEDLRGDQKNTKWNCFKFYFVKEWNLSAEHTLLKCFLTQSFSKYTHHYQFLHVYVQQKENDY